MKIEAVATASIIFCEGKMFSQIYDYENLLRSWKQTCRLKKYREDMMIFRRNLDENLIIIQNELIWKTYKVSGYRNYVIYEPKKRLISSLPVRDRIVQHALVNVIEPGIDKQFIYDSHACRVGHGLKTAVDRFIKFSKANKYCLKCDITAYFPSIDHDVLKRLFRMKIQCEETLWLIDNILDSTCSPGLPIGNLLSQLSANLYLHELDLYVKHKLGIRFYLRYMDDFVVFSDSRRDLYQIKNCMREFLIKRLHLTLSERKSILYETSKGVDYCGFRCFSTHAVVKKDTRKKNYKRMKELSAALQDGAITPEEFSESLLSIIGHSFYSRNYSYRLNLFDSISKNLDKNSP